MNGFAGRRTKGGRTSDLSGGDLFFLRRVDRERERRPAACIGNAGAKNVDGCREASPGKSNPLEPGWPPDRQRPGKVAQPPRVRTLSAAQRALQIRTVLHPDQPSRSRRCVKDVAILADDREVTGFARLIFHAARRFEQRAGLVRGEDGAIF